MLSFSQVLSGSEAQEAREVAIAKLARSTGGVHESLASTLRCGISFHHAGLTSDERMEVEKVFIFNNFFLLATTFFRHIEKDILEFYVQRQH